MVLADKGYYNKWNFALMQDLRAMLFTLPKRNVGFDNGEDGAQLIALLDALRREYPTVFRRFYRLRAKIEGFFSAQKRRNGYIRTKIRRRDLDRMLRLRRDPYDFPKALDGNRSMVRGYRMLFRVVAMGRVSTAHANQARLKAVAFNLRRLTLLEKRHGIDANFDVSIPFTRIRRVSLPA